MSFLSVRRIAQSAVVVSLVAGGIGFANLDKSVNLSVDGKSSAVHVFGSSTVGDVLTDQDIKLSSHDLVSPAVSTPLAEGQKVVVRYGRLLTVTVDGKTKEFWTTSTTVAGALTELGIRADSAKLSVSRAQPLGRMGLSMSVSTPKNVAVVVDGKTKKATTTGATVADALSELKVKVGAKDRVSPALKTPVRDDQKVVVKRVTQKSVTTTEAIAFGTQRRNDSSLYTGTTKTRTAGKEGSKRVNHLQTLVDGKLSTSKFRASRVTKAPVTRVLVVGTKSRPAPAPAPSAPSSSGGGSNENGAMWDRIAECESGGNWSTNTGNGYYGGLQFDIQTWSGAGGDKYGSNASQATREQQIEIANKVYADRGLQPWQCGWAA